MNRRAAGLAVLIVVVLVATLLPRVLPRSIAGTAEIGPIPARPVVGDCLLAPIRSAAPALDGVDTSPPVSTGPCTGRRFGEVVAVVVSPKVEAPIVSPTDGSVADPNTTACDDDMTGFFGITTGIGGQPQQAGGWLVLPPAVRSMRVGPTAVQKAAGQDWIACVEYLDPDYDVQTRAIDYRQTAAGTFRTGSPPAAFSTCLQSRDAAALELSSCRRPHSVELFGFAFGTETTSRSLLTNTCQLLVRRYTGMADPTAGGRLAVTVDLVDGNGKTIPDGTRYVSAYSASCIVTPTAGRKLIGPLMGLGDKAVPLN